MCVVWIRGLGFSSTSHEAGTWKAVAPPRTGGFGRVGGVGSADADGLALSVTPSTDLQQLLKLVQVTVSWAMPDEPEKKKRKKGD